jgi:apolipoprotein N-acyltransferase
LQGNVSQDIKFREEMLPQMLRSYLELARSSKAKLIILPESAFPIFRHELPEDYLALLTAHARANGGDLLYGIFEYEDQTRSIYNTVMSTGTSAQQTYRKHHLVAFGEFIPLKALIGWIYEDLLNMPLADQTAGPARQAPLNAAGQKIAVDICYEDAFGAEIIRPLPAATLLVNVSNDGWFGRSLGPQQHLQIAQARALETGRYLLRATNTGVTAIINARGVVLQRAPEFVTTKLEGSVQGYTGATPYVRWGNYPIVCLSALALMLSCWRQRVTREKIPAATSSLEAHDTQ